MLYYQHLRYVSGLKSFRGCRIITPALRLGLVSTFLLLILSGVFTPQLCKSQDFKADLTGMYNAYRELTSLSARVKVQVFDQGASSKPSILRNAYIKKQNSNFLINMDNMVMLYTDTIGLIINHDEKTIFCGAYHPGDMTPATSITGLDSLLQKINKVIYQGAANSQKHYTLHTSDNMIKQTDIYFSTTTRFISKIVYNYNYTVVKQNIRVVIDYLEFDTALVFPTGLFSPEKYVTIRHKKILPAKAYTNYQMQINF
jgi:hypothetical protein